MLEKETSTFPVLSLDQKMLRRRRGLVLGLDEAEDEDENVDGLHSAILPLILADALVQLDNCDFKIVFEI